MRLAFEDTIASIVVGDLSSSSFHMGVDNNTHIIFSSGSVLSGTGDFTFDYDKSYLNLTGTMFSAGDINLADDKKLYFGTGSYIELDATGGEEYLTISATGEGLALTGSNVVVEGTLKVTEKLEHVGDSDTKITFTDDKIKLTAGGLDLLELEEAGSDTISFNTSVGDVDFVLYKQSSAIPSIYVSGSDGLVHMNHGAVIRDNSRLTFGTTGSYVGYESHAGSTGEDFLVMSGSADGLVLSGSSVVVDGTLKVAEYIEHVGDSDTSLRFTNDALLITVGDAQMISLNESTADIIALNPAAADIDFALYKDSAALASIYVSGSDGLIHMNYGSVIPDNKRLTFGTTGSYIGYEGHAGSTGEDFLVLSGSANGMVLSGSSVIIDGTLSGASPLLVSGNIEQTGGGILTDFVSNPSTIGAGGVTVPESSNTVMYGPITTPDGSTFTVSDSSLVKIIDLSEL